MGRVALGIAPQGPGKEVTLPPPLRSELHVKVSLHVAQAFTNATRRTRPLLSVVLAHGSADGSGHSRTRNCRPCQWSVPASRDRRLSSSWP
jgi:hypothetical protein